MITKNNIIAVCIVLLLCFGISGISFAQSSDSNNNTESKHEHKNKDKHDDDDDDDDNDEEDEDGHKDKLNKKPFWSLNGNDNVNATKHFLGTTVSDQPLNFRTNNLLRMTLTGEGRLGSSYSA